MNLKPNWEEKIKSAIIGTAVGDALGVPVEFYARETVLKNPITGMKGFGSHHQPAGTWSDDSSMTFCTLEAMITAARPTDDIRAFIGKGPHHELPELISGNFLSWLHQKYWTPYGSVFDVGGTTRTALQRPREGVAPEFAGGDDEQSNGNGALMRMIPLVFYFYDVSMEERFAWARKISSITHAHVRSGIACFYYIEFARGILKGENKFEVYLRLKSEVSGHLQNLQLNPNEIAQFDRLLKGNIYEVPEYRIFSSGYVLHTLEAAVWCLLTTDNFNDAVLRAVNLGEDTDTTGSVTGGLAGLLYGFDAIPEEWINKLARKNEVLDLCKRFHLSMQEGK